MVYKDDVSLLIERAIGGDERSLERLLIRHYADLARHIGPRIPSPIQSQCTVEDIVQETFVAFFTISVTLDHSLRGRFSHG